MSENSMWNLELAETWEVEQIRLGIERFYSGILPLIRDISGTEAVRQEVSKFTSDLVVSALPLMIEGRAENPVHHSFYVLENMLWVTKKEVDICDEVSILKTRISIALLHDIGDAKAHGKVKTSEIRDAVDMGKSDEDIRELVERAINFRVKHMSKGAALAALILADHMSQKQVRTVYEIIAVHDNPTVSFILQEFGQFAQGDADSYLFSSPEDDLKILLREVDRLWMVCEAGIRKDMMDRAIKGREPKSPQDQLLYNIGRFQEEREIYERANGNFGCFPWPDIFFRNKGSFELFRAFLKRWAEYPEMRQDSSFQAVLRKYSVDYESVI